MKNLYCFISSTFKDMQFERDILKKIIIPTINETLNKCGVNIECIDLRWGIDTKNMSEIESYRKVLQVCFNEIQKSNPYFITFVGEKYGTIPTYDEIKAAFYSYGLNPCEYSEKSITNMEIQYANNFYIDHSKMLFFFRNDLDYCNDIDAKFKYAPKDNEEKKRVRDLKNELICLYPNQCFQYDATFNIEKKRIEINASNIDNISNIILKHIDYNENVLKKNIYEINETYFNVFIAKNNLNFAGREEELNIIDNFIDKSKHKLLVIKGESGIGKTFLMSNLVSKLEDKNIKHVKYFCGLNNETSTVENLIKHIIYHLNGQNEKELDSLTIDNFIENINNLSNNKKICIVIDSIDKLKNSSKTLKIFNTFQYTKNIKIILSVVSNFDFIKQIDSFDRENLILKHFNKDDAEIIFDKFFISNKKDKLENVQRYLFNNYNNKLVTNPIYLSLIIQKLNNLSYKDFEEINKSNDYSNSLEKYLISIISKSRNSIVIELNNFKEFIINEIQNSNVFFDVISISDDGISFSEMEYIFKQIHKTFYPVDYGMFLKMCSTFVSEYEDGYWKYKHAFIRDCYLKSIDNTNFILYNNIVSQYYELENKLILCLKYAIRARNYKKIYYLLIENMNNMDLINNFENNIDNNDFKNLLVNLLTIDNNNLFIEFMKRLMNEYKISYDNAKLFIDILSKNFYDKYYLFIDDLNVSFIKLAFYFNEYKNVAKLIKKTKIINKLEQINNIDLSLDFQVIYLVSNVYLNKINLNQIQSVLDQRYENSNISKDNARKFLDDLDLFFKTLSNTNMKFTFFTHYNFLQMLEVLEQFENEEEKIKIISNCCLYVSHRILSNYLKKKDKIIKENLEIEEQNIRKFKLIIDSFIESDNNNLALKAELALNMAKYCDNYQVTDDYKYAEKARNLYRELLKNDFNQKNLFNYAVALNLKILNDEMCGKFNSYETIRNGTFNELKESLEDLLSVSKQLVYYYPSTLSYDMLKDSYNKCKRYKSYGLYSVQDKIDENNVKLDRKKSIRFELSEQNQNEKREFKINVIFIFAIISIFYLLYRGLICLISNLFDNKFFAITFSNYVYDILVTYVVISLFFAISLKNILNILLNNRNKLIIEYVKLIFYSIILLFSVRYYDNYIADLNIFLQDMSLENVFFISSILLASCISTIVIVFILRKDLAKKLIRNSSDIINYNQFVINIKFKIINYIVGFIVSIYFLSKSIYIISILEQFVNVNLSEYLYLLILFSVLKILIIVIVLLINVFDIFLIVLRYLQSKKRSK